MIKKRLLSKDIGKVSIFGLGYVGAVVSVCAALRDYKVIGVDINREKVRMMQEAEPPFLEPKFKRLLKMAIRSGKLSPTTDYKKAILDSDISFICVGTPTKKSGDIDLSSLKRVCRKIADTLMVKHGYHVVVIRSTVLPGMTRGVVQPILETYSNKKAGQDFGLAVNPEFLREGSAIEDFYRAPIIVIGAVNRKSSVIVERFYKRMNLKSEIAHVSMETAELLKYISNMFHALKVTFANEIGLFCRFNNIDGRLLMDLFCRDKKLNISSSYLCPGLPFGGSCLSKDLKAFLKLSMAAGLKLPLTSSIMKSNELCVRKYADYISGLGKKKVGFLGVSFKAGSDDLRESQVLNIAKVLLDRGIKVFIYDKNINVDNLYGSSRNYVDKQFPELYDIFCRSLGELVHSAEVIVLSQPLNPGERKQISLVGRGKIIADISNDGCAGKVFHNKRIQLERFYKK